MRDYPYSIAADNMRRIQATGRFIWLKTAGDVLRVEAFTESGQLIASLEMSEGNKLQLVQPFARVEIINSTPATVAGVVVIGEGNADHQDVNVSVTTSVDLLPGGTLGGSNDVAVASTATVLLSAFDATKREVWVSCISGAVRIGAAPAAANGHPLQAGDAMLINTKAAVSAYGVDAGGSVVSVVEVKT